MSQKQPPPANAQESAERTVEKLREVRSDLGVETYGPSSERAKTPGNLNPTPPEDRKPSPGPMQTAPAAVAAGHLAAAEAQILSQETSDRLIKSDPRHERDQEVFELSRTGKIGLVPPSEADVATLAARSGLPQEVIDKLPKTPEEQVAQDAPRLAEARERAAAQSPTAQASGTEGTEETKNRPPVVQVGEQEGAPRNNLQAMVDAGKTPGGAEGEKQRQAQAVTEAGKTDQSHIIK
jgi:hypothetical protein